MNSSSHIVVFVLLALALAQSAACGDDSEFVSVGEGRDRELPNGDRLDGSTIADGATGMDGATSLDGSTSGDGSFEDLDAGSYLDNLPDGSVVLDGGGVQLPDGEVLDQATAEMRYGPEVDVSSCEISELDVLEVDTKIEDEGGFALTPGYTGGFGLAFQSITTGDCNSNLGTAYLPSLGALPTPMPILPDCKVLHDVALLALADAWQLAWVDNFTGHRELHTLLLDTQTMQAKGAFARETITDSLAQDESKPVLAQIAGHTLLTWITNEDDTYSVMGKFLDGPDTQPFAIVGGDTEQAPQAVAVSRMGLENRGAVAWVGPIANPGVWLQTLDDEGKPSGAPSKLTTRVGASSSVDLAPRNDGGGAVYSIVIDGIPQVRFHRIDTNGEPRDGERALVAAPFRGQDASLAAIGGGYAVAYRALPGDGQSQPEIRLMFVTREGNVSRDEGGRPISFLISEATISTGRTYIEVAIDGQIMIGWLDSGTGDSNVLKVARRRLDCDG